MDFNRKQLQFNISVLLSYYIFDQINAALVKIRAFQKHK